MTLFGSLCLAGGMLGALVFTHYGPLAKRTQSLAGRLERLDSHEYFKIRIWDETVATPKGTYSYGLPLTNGTHLHTFRIKRPGPDEPGWYSEAWIMDCQPPAELLKFEEFELAPDDKNGVILWAKPATNGPILMRFRIATIMK